VDGRVVALKYFIYILFLILLFSLFCVLSLSLHYVLICSAVKMWARAFLCQGKTLLDLEHFQLLLKVLGHQGGYTLVLT